MKNKIIIIVVIAVLAIAALFYFLKVGISGGSKTLTRDKAAKMIMAKLEPTTGVVSYDQMYHAYAAYGTNDDKLKSLENAGLIKIVTEPHIWSLATLFLFTDKGQSYTAPNQNLSSMKDIILGQPSSVVVTGLTESAADKSGHNIITAKYIAKFKLTPFGQILSNSDERRGSYDFTLYDDGWRIGN